MLNNIKLNVLFFYFVTTSQIVNQISCSILYFEPSKNFDRVFRKTILSSVDGPPAPTPTASDPAAKEGVHWALLVAGSNTWGNYRHQADVSHAYQIVRRHGIAAERIVTMMYDDIAKNEQNPTAGKIINHPNGGDVYEGVIIDYRGQDVNAENFLGILSGNETFMNGKGSGKVIKSGPNDHLFVNFVDHGAPGLLAFPDTELYAKDLIDTLLSMNSKKQFAQMVMYIEACESGSMFKGLLPSNINIYVTTAANDRQSSYACYYDEERSTYLGDVYSVNWMEDSDKENLNLETLHKQYLIVKAETNESEVCQFGNYNISKETLNNFQGKQNATNFEPIILPKVVPKDSVASHDVPLAILYRKLDNSNDFVEKKILKNKIKKMILKRDQINDSMKSIIRIASSAINCDLKSKMKELKYDVITKHTCYKTAVKTFDLNCFDINQDGYALKSLRTLLDLCESGLPTSILRQSILHSCKHLPKPLQ